MRITNDELSTISLKPRLESIFKNYSIEQKEIFGPPGKEFYTFMAYLASLHPGSTIIDIGTHWGAASLAMSISEATIYSFDVKRKVFLRDLPNVNYELADLWDETVFSHWESTIMNSAIIFIDVEPHNGIAEYEMYKRLKEKGYKGLIVFDDIWYFKGMRDNLWGKIPSEEKVDVTAIAHWSGTGVVSFVPRDIVWETYAGLQKIGTRSSNYTVVTAYFDLTRMSDASPSIKARPKEYYLENARATMALDQPLVVFCENDSLDALKAIRPVHLIEKTQFCVVDFETLPMTTYRDQIIKNRQKNSYRGDDRNTASYYLLCMARYALLKRVMDTNPFNTTNFAWLNICIERMGYTNLVHLDQVFSTKREKVSTTYIDYIAKDALEPKKYYEFGRCSLCSGFFTGAKPYLYEFCNRIEEKFLHYLNLGYGHADEQLYTPVYFDAPEIFDLYYGDYTSMITNYAYTYETKMPVHYVIPKSLAAKDWRTCINACRFVWKACKGEERTKVLNAYARCAFELGEKMHVEASNIFFGKA